MPTISETWGGSNAGTIDEEFLDLVCSDEELLRAEFEAIVAAEWPMPPMRPPRPSPAGRPPSPRRVTWWADTSGRLVSRPRHPGIGGWGRQRSPPRRRHPPYLDNPQTGSGEPTSRMRR